MMCSVDAKNTVSKDETSLCSLHCAFFSHSQSELPYATWQEVQARIVEIQKEHQICIHKKELTELDIYHRILRFKNYMVCLFVVQH